MTALVLCALCLVLCTSKDIIQTRFEKMIESSRRNFGGELVPVNDPNWYFTEHNWIQNGQYMQSVNPGAYFKVSVEGTTSMGIMLNFDETPSADYMTVRFTVDDAPYQDIVLPSGITEDTLWLAAGMNMSVIHTAQVWIKNSVQSDDRWQVPLNKLVIAGLIIDSGSKLVPPTLRSKRLMFYWDSIGEGVRTLNVSSGGDLTDNDSTCTWADALAAALDAELNAIAFGGQGYVSWGTAVPLLYPGRADWTAWNQYYANMSRLDQDGQLTPNPDYVLCGHGTNDQSALDSTITSLAFQWMMDFRAAAPNTVIFLTVPFGGFFRDAITLAFQQYRATGDDMVELLDLGIAGGLGVSEWGEPNAQSGDGLHPLAVRSEQLGAMLTGQMVAKLQNILSRNLK